MKKALSLLVTLGLTCSLALPVSALEVDDARKLIQTYYVDDLPAHFETLENLDDILSSLGDPYTDYLSAQEYEQLLQSLNGTSLIGIGIIIQSDFHDGYLINSVLSNSPAEQAGLSQGDTVVAVDGQWLTSSHDCRALILGEEGTDVSITVRSKNSKTLRTVIITRQQIVLPIVTYGMVDDALVISCDSFGESTIPEIKNALNQYENQASLTIMDLRANPGGTAHSACGSAGLFVGPGLMSCFRNSAGQYERLHASLSCPDLTDKAVIVLLSPDSASGSELFSSIIRDYQAGISLGQRSYGKGSVQQLFDQRSYPEFFDGDCLKITTQRFFSPNGTSNHITGILPTLLLSAAHTPTAAMLLSFPKPESPSNFLMLELAGQTFYIDLELAMLEHNRSAFTELLEALPPSAALSLGEGDGWVITSPAQLSAVLGLPFISRAFSDTSNSPYARELDTLSCYRLLSGYEDNTFQPQQLITRAEFCAMLCSVLALPTSDIIRFSDVSPESWYAGAIGAMAGRDFIAGDGDNRFRPDDPITYQEITAILANISAWVNTDGYEYKKIPLTQSDQERYAAFSPWAQQAARNLNMFDALIPDISPAEFSTREIAAASLCRLMEYTGLLWN